MERFRQAIARFFYGRRGMDELGLALYLLFFVLTILARVFAASFVGTLLYWLSLAALIYGFYRMLSKKLSARMKENDWFLGWFRPLKTRFSQAKTRFKNRKIYKYYRCPKCKSWLRLPRGIGEKTVTCGHCGASFQKKA